MREIWGSQTHSHKTNHSDRIWNPVWRDFNSKHTRWTNIKCMPKSVRVNTCVPSLSLFPSVCVWACQSGCIDTKTTCQPWVAVSRQPCHTAPGALLRCSFVPGPASSQLHATAHHAPCALPAAPPERGAMWDTSQSAGWCLPPVPPLLPLRGSPSLSDRLTLSARLKNALILSGFLAVIHTVPIHLSASLPQSPNISLLRSASCMSDSLPHVVVLDLPRVCLSAWQIREA